MKTLILYSNRPLETHSIALISKQTSGMLYDFIKIHNNKNLENYDQIVLVYQHPLNSINKQFVQFCDSNPSLVKESILVIDIPMPYAKKFDMESLSDQINNFRNTMISDYNYNADNAAAILINETVGKQTQMDYAKNLGYAPKQSITEGIEHGFRLFVMFSHVSEMYGNMTMLKANCSIIAGTFAIPLGLLIFYLGIVLYNTPPAFGAALTMIGGGPILAYVGVKNRRYLQWLKN